jgi:ankyrin repeat protein
VHHFKILHITNAAANGHLECVKYLQENGCPWDLDIYTNTAAKGHLECVKYLLENGCSWDEEMCVYRIL